MLLVPEIAKYKGINFYNLIMIINDASIIAVKGGFIYI